eukprot:3700497-Amphidinium_carterae.1
MSEPNFLPEVVALLFAVMSGEQVQRTPRLVNLVLLLWIREAHGSREAFGVAPCVLEAGLGGVGRHPAPPKSQMRASWLQLAGKSISE